MHSFYLCPGTSANQDNDVQPEFDRLYDNMLQLLDTTRKHSVIIVKWSAFCYAFC